MRTQSDFTQIKDLRNIDINLVKINPENPRLIKNHEYKKLKKSIIDDPYMESQREIIVDENLMVLGGNMRLKVFKELGYKSVLVSVFSSFVFNEYKKLYPKSKDSTYEQACRNIVMIDNKSFGEWDWDMTANLWSEEAKAYEIGFEYEENDFKPDLAPETNYSEVTQAQIQEEAKKLAKQMIKERQDQDVICPECGNEFGYQI
tara:strand:- start:533 stop:1141 length:609 start_codon:yes stop_codon:yes gene_type:complete